MPSASQNLPAPQGLAWRQAKFGEQPVSRISILVPSSVREDIWASRHWVSLSNTEWDAHPNTMTHCGWRGSIRALGHGQCLGQARDYPREEEAGHMASANPLIHTVSTT